jgi:hypothetical protein
MGFMLETNGLCTKEGATVLDEKEGTVEGITLSSTSLLPRETLNVVEDRSLESGSSTLLIVNFGF